ncbi:hybrid sensor histidine kinase/response regulator transcription factor [Paraflavitalea sp. CAU 1676]|uniref:hybrid sensor histidine kinase/response regulator transcription factor n=1 Tax=Paraflavitalea sp. CAU 1676 TaxID=3032598 RepID=UPI0023DA56E5|nr:hybrid sensor histidine kinase/response regulator transcription factor [Paraflavitalea sp. CAU 1676]MDF2191264.1 two-component regulator propeller domain-containing protein [Paraflavitalea sp. CAU 1676]
MKHIPFFILCLAAWGSYAQPKHIDFTSITVKDGLLSNSIFAILKDRHGLMWFATTDGLNKYDGTNFTVYRNIPDDSTSLRANEILALHEDKAGKLWLGTGGGGLSLYNRQKNTFEHFTFNAAGLTSNAVIKSICSDYRGRLWIAAYARLYVMDTALRSVSEVFLPDANGNPLKTVVESVFEDSKHRIWIGTYHGLFRYSMETNSFRRFIHQEGDASSLGDQHVRVIAEDKSGTIWVGTVNGLSKLLPDEQHFFTYRHIPGNAASLTDNGVNCITADDDGLLWIGTRNGLNALHIATGKLSTYTKDDGNIYSFTGKSISCAWFDKEGIYWFGTFMRGINKYDKNINLFGLKLSGTFNKNGGASLIVTGFAEDTQGKVYVATYDGGLYEFDHRTGRVRPIEIKLNGKPAGPLTIMALHRGPANRLLIGTYGKGVIVLNTNTGQTMQIMAGNASASLYAHDVHCIGEDSKGNTWIGTNGAGIHVVHDDKVVVTYSPTPSGPRERLLPINGYIRAIVEDTDKNIWIGTHGGGLAIYHPVTDTWTIYSQSNSQLPSNKIQSLLCDRRGTMWVGTDGGGLSFFDKQRQQFTRYTEKDGLQNTTIYQLVEDMRGQLWLSTNTGISSMDPVARRFRNFTHHNGIQHSNFFHGSGIRLTDGEMLFGGLEGINYFHPDALTINRNVPKVLLTDLRISNKSVMAETDAPIKEHISIANEIRLDYKQNFALSFVALNYTLAKQNQYAYRLEGLEKDWNYTGTNNTASYTNLDPGTYTFHVKASNNDGVWNTAESRIKIYVRPPFWRTTAAYVFYILALGGLILYSRYRVLTALRKKLAREQEAQQSKRLQELDRLKLKFLTNLSHDFRTPISLISGPVEQLIDAEKTTAKLDKLYLIRRNSKRLLNLVNQLLDFRKLEEQELKLQLAPGEFVSFVKEVSESFRDLSERKHINFSFSSTLQHVEVLFDHDKVERILFNLLSNAFKFTLEGGHISVVLEEAPERNDGKHKWVTLKVTDSGIGMPKETFDKIYDRFFQHDASTTILNYGTGIGLSITREFVNMHGGIIHVESEPDQGSTFTIHLPLIIASESMVTSPPPAPAAGKAVSPKSVSEPANKKGLPIILLVEDNDDFRFYLKDNLADDHMVIEAENGKVGWQKALAHHPQLIISDISMPKVNGIEMVNKLKADKRTSHIPIILLTALNDQQQQVNGLATGANDYITKPFDFEVLQAKIRSLLELNSAMKSTYIKQISLKTPDVRIDSSDEIMLQKIVLFLEQNINNPQLSVEGLSKQFGMSRSTLYTKLLQITGQTPVEYIRSFRLEKAAVLMEKSNMTIAEIAYHVGFTTPNYFARSFKHKFGILPSEYVASQRKENRGDNGKVYTRESE